MDAYTPLCVAKFVLWDVDGSAFELEVQKKPTGNRQLRLAPGETDNFVCNLESVMEFPTAKVGQQPLDVNLLEVLFQVEVNYKTSLPFYSLHREYSSQEFCGIRTRHGFRWITGSTTAPDNEITAENARRSIRSGYLSRCISRSEGARLYGTLTYEFTSKNKSNYIVKMPRGGGPMTDECPGIPTLAE
jgi:hypothetical protein